MSSSEPDSKDLVRMAVAIVNKFYDDVLHRALGEVGTGLYTLARLLTVLLLPLAFVCDAVLKKP